MKKTISIIMAFVIALSVCAVMTFASDSAESIIKDRFVLATTSEKTTASTFAIGETVYGKVSGDGAQCYKLVINEKTNIDFEFVANSNIDVTIEKSDGSDKTVLTGDKLYEKTVSLDEANYYITVKNFVPAVEEEPSTEETTEEETSKTIENDIGELSLQSADDAEAEFKFVASVKELPVAYVKINHNTAELTSGETLQLKLYDCTIENLNHFWRVFDDPATDLDETKVATVTADGLVRIEMGNKDFNKETTVKVQAVMYYDGVAATKTCTIKATPSNVYLEPYFGDKDDNCLQLGVGAYRLIKATTNVDGGKIVWSVNEDGADVVTVNASGKITAIGVGQAIVTATLEGTTTKRNILVKVDTDYTSVMGVKLDKNTAEVRANEGFALTYTFETMPEDDATPSNSKVIFTSSDPAVATVDENGNVTGVAEGTATITITTEDGSYTDECKVTVTKAIPNWLMVIIAPFRMLYNLILLIIDKVK